jgi:ATP-binding cassette subfamily B protein
MKETLRTTWPYVKRYRGRMVLGMTALVVKDLAAVMQPFVIGQAIDSLMRGFRMDTVLWLAFTLVALSAIKGIFQYWMRVILIGVSRDIEYDLRNDLFDRLVTLSSDFYAKFRTGDIMARATNDLNAVRMMLGPGVMYWTETSITLLLSIAIMAFIDWPLTLVALIPAPLVSLAVIYFGRRIHHRFERIQAMFSDISSRVQENLSGVRVVRAYVQEQAELAQFERLNKDYIIQNIRLARLSGLFMPLLQALVGLTFLMVLWAGGYRLLQGHITIGQFVMFQTYMGMLVWPMIAFGWVVNLMQRGTASLSRINQLMRSTPSITQPPNPRDLPDSPRGEIEFQNVAVQYPEGKSLAGVSLRIPGGSTVAVVGHTGSGKTTLVHLIGRIIDPTSGRVLVDGIDIREFSPERLRSIIGFVPQETFLFSATLGDNIAFGVPDATPEAIEKAADLAGLSPDLHSFPKRLDTMVGERGLTLSGGQKQRTAIARAILRDPRILILDDALSSVDTVTEEQILRGLSGVMRNRTTILISHRVSTIRHADMIVVLEDGRIVEHGTHSELIAAGGYYTDLYQKQLLEEELEAI